MALVMCVLAASGALLWKRERGRMLDRFAARTAANLAGVIADFEAALQAGREDALFLAECPEARAAAKGDPGRLRDLEQLFLAYASSKTEIIQVRLLDNDGNEKLRVDRAGGKVAVTAELQNKADRDYFVTASGMKHFEVYTSPLDLNVEHGRVQLPPVPTLRFATPVFDTAGARGGVLVVNRAARPLLDRVARARGGIPGELVLVDPAGVYLSHPDAAREWGAPTMLGTGHTLWKDHPEVARRLYGGGRRPAFRGDGFVAVRAPLGERSIRLQLVAIVKESDALASREFVPLLASFIIAAVLSATVLLWSFRQRRLWRTPGSISPEAEEFDFAAGQPRWRGVVIRGGRQFERRVIDFTTRYGISLLRVSLGVVFIWFGALKVLGVSPVQDLVTKIIYMVPKQHALLFMGLVEIVIGFGLLFRVMIRLTMAVFLIHMCGTFLVLLLHPELSFQEGNPLLLTTTGEFVIKNLVLLAAGLVVVSSLRRADESLWPQVPQRVNPAMRSRGRSS
jgi:putative oxidoreductase